MKEAVPKGRPLFCLYNGLIRCRDARQCVLYIHDRASCIFALTDKRRTAVRLYEKVPILPRPLPYTDGLILILP
jgi:hypothetical protein